MKIKQSTFIILLTAISLVGFISWSLWAELDQITRAPGQVIPSGRIQIIQASDNGVIQQIHIRDGDRVRRGQLLVTLESTTQRAAVDEGNAKVASLRTQMVRIQAELFDRPLVFPEEVSRFPEFVANQRALYTQRRTALREDVANLRRTLALMREELAMNTPLVESGDVARSEILRMQRSISDLEGQITNKRNTYLQELQTEYARIEDELSTSVQALAQRQTALERTELRAPSDGVVVNVRFTTLGAVVRPGDEVMQIVPTADELIVEARVSPADIAFIRVGQEASVKFDAYDSAIYGSGQGRVTYVSADTLTEETEEGRVSYYRVHLRVDTRQMRPRLPGERIEIQPGMTVTAEIKTGETTVFRYLTKPLLKTVDESMSER